MKKISPMILGAFVITIILPLLALILLSFVERYVWADILPRDYSLRAFRVVFENPKVFLKILLTSTFISFVVAIASVVISIFSARAIIIYDVGGKHIINFVAMLPLIMPATVFVLGINSYFIRWGLSKTLFGVIIVHILYSQPYALKIITDAIRAVGKRYEEAGKNLGASSIQTFFKITLPLISPAISSALSMSFIISFSQYFLTLMIGGGKVQTFNIVIVPFLTGGDRNIASLYSVIFLITTAIMLIVFNLISKLILKEKVGEYYSI